MAAFTGSVSSLPAAHTPSASEMSFITLSLQALTGVWTSYSPSLSASAGTPAVGNGSWSGYYMQSGKLVLFRIALVFGSTSTYGTLGATLSVTLPVNLTTVGTPRVLHDGTFFDTSAGTHFPIKGRVTQSSTGVANLLQFSGTAGNAMINFANNSPATLATGDEIHLWGMFETP